MLNKNFGKSASSILPEFGLSKALVFISIGYRSTTAMTPPDDRSEKESLIVYDISPQLEEELLRRARENNRDLPTEASKIIEQHVDEESNLD